MTTASPLEEMFAGLDPASRAERFERYKSALQQSIDDAQSGRYTFEKVGKVSRMRPSGARVTNATAALEKIEALTKGMSDEQAKTVQGDLEAAKAVLADVQKDWQIGIGGATANPTTELVPYDLQRPLKELVPLHTPLRNSIPRNNMGEGTATHWKQLDSLQNSGIGTAGEISPFFSSQVDTETFGSIALRRGKKIDYVTSDHVAKYVEMGLSDSVTDVAQYAGLGFANHLQLSQHALAWTHLMAEERAQLYGRGATANGYTGAVGAPGSVTAVGSGSGTLDGVYRVIVLANAGFGTSVRSSEITTGTLTDQNLTITVGTEPAGAINYSVYVTAAGGGAGTETLQATMVGNSITLTSIVTGEALPTNVDRTQDANGYDGFLTNLPAQGGFVKRENGLWSRSNPGTELQVCFQELWEENFARPDEVWMDSNVKVGLGDALQAGVSSLPYRIQLSQTDGLVGTAVTGIQNILTSEIVPLKVHPFMPRGAVMVRSTRMPYPAAGISATSEVRTVQDYMSISWPKIQHTTDYSTYFYGTLIHYAPKFSGVFLGVQGVEPAPAP